MRACTEHTAPFCQTPNPPPKHVRHHHTSRHSLLAKKIKSCTYERAFGKPFTFKVSKDAMEKAAALLACAPAYNGIGIILKEAA